MAHDDARQISVERRTIECVEIYVPKRLETQSELYRYLREKMTQREGGSAVIDGFSVYEVDGGFYGDRIYQERTLVIRLLFVSHATTAATLDEQISSIGREIATTVALTEEELWICHYPQRMLVFRPAAD